MVAHMEDPKLMLNTINFWNIQYLIYTRISNFTWAILFSPPLHWIALAILSISDLGRNFSPPGTWATVVFVTKTSNPSCLHTTFPKLFEKCDWQTRPHSPLWKIVKIPFGWFSALLTSLTAPSTWPWLRSPFSSNRQRTFRGWFFHFRNFTGIEN